MTTKTIIPSCFGKLFDSADADCKKCQVNGDCENAIAGSKVQPTPVALEPEMSTPTPADPVTPPTPVSALENEAEATIEAEAQIAADTATKKTKKTSSPVSGARNRTALKSAAFKKDDNGKLILVDPATTKDPDLLISAGDIVKIVNPRSKYNGQQFIVSCYSEKYKCFRGTQPDTKTNADFLPHQIEVVERAKIAIA